MEMVLTGDLISAEDAQKSGSCYVPFNLASIFDQLFIITSLPYKIDQHATSPCNIHTSTSKRVMRIFNLSVQSCY